MGRGKLFSRLEVAFTSVLGEGEVLHDGGGHHALQLVVDRFPPRLPVQVLNHCGDISDDISGPHHVRSGQPLQLLAGVVHVEILQNGERGDVVNVGVAT